MPFTHSLSLSVFGPQGLRLVRVTDVSLLVEWESVRGAEYYVLTYHPKGDKSGLEQVVFFLSVSVDMSNKGCSVKLHFSFKKKSLIQLVVSQVRIPNTENSYLITGLIPGVTYIVQVHAVIKKIQSEADKIEATTGKLLITWLKDFTEGIKHFTNTDIHFW